MNYKNIYETLILKSKNRIKPQCYCEKHHIIPKCLGGNNDSSNLTYLTGKEHYIAHHLLFKMYPTNNKIFFAFIAMNNWKSKNTSSRYIPLLSAKQYEKLKIQRKEHISNLLKNVPKTEEHKKNLSKANMGKHLSKETKNKISESLKKIEHTDEWNEKVSVSLKKYIKTEKHCKNISLAKKGKHINYNKNSGFQKGEQCGVKNNFAKKFYIDNVLIGCKKETIKYFEIYYKITYRSRILYSIFDLFEAKNFHITKEELHNCIIMYLNKHNKMPNRLDILSQVKV